MQISAPAVKRALNIKAPDLQVLNRNKKSIATPQKTLMVTKLIRPDLSPGGFTVAETQCRLSGFRSVSRFYI